MPRTTKNETGLRHDRSSDACDRSIARILPRENNAARRGLQKVKVGDAERDVIAKMGRPHQVLDGCGYYGRPIVGCAREYVYFPPWTIVDEAWAFSLNVNGVVINSAHFVSP